MNLLLTSGGRRVELIQAFRQALAGSGQVFATDLDRTAPALYVADEGFQAPGVRDPGYVEYLLRLVERKQIRAIFPLIDPELPLLAAASSEFAARGCRVMVMDHGQACVAADKWLTAQFFERNGIPMPRTTLPTPTGELPVDFPLPVVVKPRIGSSGKDVIMCRTVDEVAIACERVPDPLIQEMMSGDEITIDVLGDLQGRVLSIVQRKRLKIRAGEVERGITVRIPIVEELALRAATVLSPVGCINLQCFLTDRGPSFTEINARFGGGYPLAQAAGADFPKQLVQMLAGESLSPRIGCYEVGLVMMRFDSAVIRRERELLGAEADHL